MTYSEYADKCEVIEDAFGCDLITREQAFEALRKLRSNYYASNGSTVPPDAPISPFAPEGFQP